MKIGYCRSPSGVVEVVRPLFTLQPPFNEATAPKMNGRFCDVQRDRAGQYRLAAIAAKRELAVTRRMTALQRLLPVATAAAMPGF